MTASVYVMKPGESNGRNLNNIVLDSPATMFTKLEPGEFFSLYETRYNTKQFGPGRTIKTRNGASEITPTASSGVYIIRITAKTVNALKTHYKWALQWLGVEVKSSATSKPDPDAEPEPETE